MTRFEVSHPRIEELLAAAGEAAALLWNQAGNPGSVATYHEVHLSAGRVGQAVVLAIEHVHGVDEEVDAAVADLADGQPVGDACVAVVTDQAAVGVHATGFDTGRAIRSVEQVEFAAGRVTLAMLVVMPCSAASSTTRPT